jgi:hypothetical protein
MSVAALFEGRTAEVVGCELIPVATEATFERLWVPASNALGLRWVPCFQGGVIIRSDDAPEVLEELDRLRGWVTDQAGTDTRDWWLGRIDRLRLALDQVRALPGSSCWIG